MQEVNDPGEEGDSESSTDEEESNERRIAYTLSMQTKPDGGCSSQSSESMSSGSCSSPQVMELLLEMQATLHTLVEKFDKRASSPVAAVKKEDDPKFYVS